jgi:hypothetical protein
MKALIPVFLLLLLLPACEEDIYIPLHTANPVTVIEGRITNLSEPNFVRVTKTTGFYDPATVPTVTNATVFVEDDLGHTWYFTQQRPGYYLNNNFTGQPERTYTLSVKTNNGFFKASSYMPEPVTIDSLKVEYFAGTHFADAGYYIILYFTDPPGKGNYYRIRLFKGDQAGTTIYVVNDQLIDGNQINLFLFGSAYVAGDTAVAELQSIDEQVYQYLLTLSEVSASSPSSSTSTPANPVTNISGGALGYFGAIAITRDTVIIPHQPK